MASNYNNDDEFDWEAALTEIESACNKMELPLVHDNISCKINSLPLNASDDDNNIIPKSSVDMKQQKCNKLGKIPLKLPKTVRQGTLDRFVNLRNGPIGHESLNQDLSKAQTVSTCEECIELGVKSEIDPEKAETWTYPVNIPLRDYQFSIAKTALFSNTLVVLPTGLGKTLIAAVVMYNYFRWFPSGKIVFTAPSRPLVMQQIEACHNIVGIPQEYTIDMTGQMNPAQRLMYWQSKRVFFVTPQVLEKDIQSGSCMAEELVCLVVDEAHRAVGNYSYCVVVREIMAVPVQLRIVALTATPGSKQASIQLVIDNLHISTLEHRSETDPDVVPYTHNREIEMIPVVINKETLTISTLLLEVAQPVIQRLCSLGVFYNRDVSKVTPFELLTARDKFRQSPPPLLGESQYGEVEGCFGGAITVYHIYKLLFSHGVRPALEMLHQKLQQGSFARLMGRNEKLWQAKLLMQQSVSHGAPNPKLLRMEEIISEHFDAKDPSSTRVIIFTNFRESVKDIMESLFKLNDAVRAVEFIGQSSGKSSKGQTQKVQQEVLQKFRLGDYNTIVATSIGEEGLDIMEVDLVICFDANVSPLRMVQRIGRTGRKRDGRVVILASEGSELQGYLKKKAKEIALRKHMHNGGTRSFMFHASPRMVPHCYQPQVQFVEMSIKKFVPRGRRLKAGCGQSDLGRDGLVDDEKYLLEKYFGHSCQDDWKPSLIAFPHYQSFPSCIFKVKHSFRTTKMLIGTSQALQSHTCRLDFQGTKVTPSLVDVMNCQEYMEDDLLFQEQLMKNREYFSQGSHHQSHNQSIQDQVKEKYLEVTSPLSSLYRDENTEEEDTTRIKQLAESKVVQKNMNRKSLSSSVNVSGHQCLYNTGFVSVNTGGNVVIASIPCFPSSASVSDIPDHLPSEAMIEKAKVNANSVNSTKENSTSVIPERVHISGTESLPQMPCRQEAVVNACDEGIAEETSEEGENKNSYRSHEIIFDSFAHISMESPPRNKENKNSNSPESEVQVQRCNSSSFGTQTESVLVSRRVDNDIQFLKENTSIISPTVSLKCVGSTPQVTNHFGKGILAGYPFGHASGGCALGTSLKKNDSDVLKDSTNLPTLNSSEILNASLKNNNANNVEVGTQVCKMMPEKQGSIPFDGSKSLGTNHILCNEEKPLSLECSRIWNDFSAEAKHTPLDTKSNCSQDWNLTINGNEQCAQRPRKFKRLRKFKDEKENSSKMEANRTHLHTVGASIHKKLKIPKANQRFKTSALSFLDDEAEVSSDEEVSTEEDDLEESCSDTASDSFIDDSIQESISKRSEDDMLAVYRRSLLTPSPSTNQLKCFSCLESPVNDETGNLDPSISVDASSDSFLLSTSKSNATECASSHIQVKDNKSVVSIKGHHPDQESREVNLICNINMTSNTVEFRKRKLMFQDINSVDLSRCDESSASFVTLNVPLPKNGNDVSEVSHQNESLMACLDDDLFMGIDPDALEAEAIELARQRAIKPKGVEGMPPGNGCLLNENASNSYVFHQEKCLASGNSNRSQNDGTIFSKPYLITEGMQKMSIEHEDADIDVLCTPSFDLGV